MMQSKIKDVGFIRFLMFILLVSALFFSGCSRPNSGGRSGGQPEESSGEQAAAREEPAPPAVEVLEVTKGNLVAAISASGIISGVQEAFVVSETQGIVQEVNFELGRQVEKGDVLLKVDAEIARLNMEQAAEQLENARIDYQTKESLVEKGGASRADLLRARSTLRGAEARYKQTQKLFEDSSITAPISGFIAEKKSSASLGNYLSPGMQIARISDLSSLRLETAVGEGVIGLIREGAPAEITVPAACDGKTFQGKIVAVAAGSTADTGSYRVIIEWENTCGKDIKSGMSAEATIIPTTEEPVLIIPGSIPLSRNGKTVVFTTAAGTVEQKEIRTGRRVGNRLEVLSGLEEGDQLIISGITRLSPGRKVVPTTVGKTGSLP